MSIKDLRSSTTMSAAAAVPRYVPRATDPGVSGAWQVWDQLEARFLTDEEITTIDVDEVVSFSGARH